MPHGMFLSHPPMTRTPSIHCPWTESSTQSAITSRETSEYLIPSVPMAMPSEMIGVPNIWGFPPAFRIAALAASASGCRPALQGVIVECPLAIPIIGFSKSSLR